MKRRMPLWIGALAAASLFVTAAPAVAGGHGHGHDPEPPTPLPPAEVLHEGFVSPLKLALGPERSVWVSDNFAGTLNRIGEDGAVTTPYTASPPGTEAGAVSTFRDTVYFAERVGTMETVESAVVNTLSPDGEVTRLADILAYEEAENPDADQQYGFDDLDPACEAQLPEEGAPWSYDGKVDSHPYATLGSPVGTLVADAGANAILAIDRSGAVHTVAVLPPQPVEVGEWGLELGVPECAIGEEYAFEPVPTDVELGPDGRLYVTLLPGGPEDPSAGARGSVVRIDPWHGDVETVATDLAGATDLAVAPDGDIYVAELFGGRISVIRDGENEAETYREVNQPAAVEWSPLGLYATVDALPGDPTAPPSEATPPVGKAVFLPF